MKFYYINNNIDLLNVLFFFLNHSDFDCYLISIDSLVNKPIKNNIYLLLSIYKFILYISEFIGFFIASKDAVLCTPQSIIMY